jgi:hypothetical protein
VALCVISSKLAASNSTVSVAGVLAKMVFIKEALTVV